MDIKVSYAGVLFSEQTTTSQTSLSILYATRLPNKVIIVSDVTIQEKGFKKAIQ